MGDLGRFGDISSDTYSDSDESYDEDQIRTDEIISNADVLDISEDSFDSSFSSSGSDNLTLADYLLDVGGTIDTSGRAVSRDIQTVRDLTRRIGRSAVQSYLQDPGSPEPSARLRGIVRNILQDVPRLGFGGVLKIASVLCFAATNFPHVIVAESLSFVFSTFAGPKLQLAMQLALLALQKNEGKQNAVAAATLRVKNILRKPLGAGKPGSSSSIRGGTVGMYSSIGDQIFSALQFLCTLSEKGPGFAIDTDCFNSQENGDVGVIYGYPRWD